MAKHYDKQFPFNAEKRRESVKAKIKDIYDQSNRITALPKSHKCCAKQEKLFPCVLLGST